MIQVIRLIKLEVAHRNALQMLGTMLIRFTKPDEHNLCSEENEETLVTLGIIDMHENWHSETRCKR